jgi:hypothetical protein
MNADVHTSTYGSEVTQYAVPDEVSTPVHSMRVIPRTRLMSSHASP